MDLTIKSKSWGIDDQSWLASRFGLDTGRSITLNVAAFTLNTHYPDGYLKSGLPIKANATTGLYEPASATVCEGHLLKRVHVGGVSGETVSTKVGGALYWQGVVDCRFLPVVLAPAAMPATIRYENQPAEEE